MVNGIAIKEGVDPKLVAALIQTESGGDSFAWRTEAAYRYLWNVKTNRPFRPLHQAEANNEVAPADFPSLIGSKNTEWLGQQASWGPMQVMGAVAREFGYKLHFPALCGDDGIRIGCKLLHQLNNRFIQHYGIEGVVAAYNFGSPMVVAGHFTNQPYVDKVMGIYRA